MEVIHLSLHNNNSKNIISNFMQLDYKFQILIYEQILKINRESIRELWSSSIFQYVNYIPSLNYENYSCQS